MRSCAPISDREPRSVLEITRSCLPLRQGSGGQGRVSCPSSGGSWSPSSAPTVRAKARPCGRYPGCCRRPARSIRRPGHRHVLASRRCSPAASRIARRAPCLPGHDGRGKSGNGLYLRTDAGEDARGHRADIWAVPPAGRTAATGGRNCLAVNSRCSRSGAPSCRGPSSSCSMSRHLDWRRILSNTSSKSSTDPDAGTTVLMVEQNAYAALEMCDHAYLLDRVRWCFPAAAATWSTIPMCAAPISGDDRHYRDLHGSCREHNLA